MNYATTQEHVPVIKPVIRTVKEKFRDLYHLLPYRAIPTVMAQYGVKDVVKCINIVLTNVGVSNKYTPRAFLTAKNWIIKHIAR